MTNLLVMKECLKSIYGKYEVYITPLGKFFLSLITFIMINGKLGYMTKIDSLAVVLIAALLCSFLPMNFMVVMAALFILLHLYALSLECAVVVLAIILIMFLLYFRFAPGDTVAVLLTPLCCMLKVPFVVPISMGLVGTPSSAVSVGCGVMIYSILQYISESVTTLNTMDAENAVQKYRYVVDGLLNNKTMLVTLVAFVAVVFVVYFVRRLRVDHAWTIAMVAGALAGVIILLTGDLKYDTNISIVQTLIGAVISLAIVKILEFFVFNVDYSRTEYVQFEDDEYYYYVKAIPKFTSKRKPELPKPREAMKQAMAVHSRDAKRKELEAELSDEPKAVVEKQPRQMKQAKTMSGEQQPRQTKQAKTMSGEQQPRQTKHARTMSDEQQLRQAQQQQKYAQQMQQPHMQKQMGQHAYAQQMQQQYAQQQIGNPLAGVKLKQHGDSNDEV